MDKSVDLMSEIVTKTNSELILFSIILSFALLGLLLLTSRDKKENAKSEETARRQYIEREARIIEVIAANTEVMASIKTTLESSGANTVISFQRIHDRLDHIIAEQQNITLELKQALSRRGEHII